MTKDELIVKQQLRIETYEALLRENLTVKEKLIGRLYSIGSPLNDNILNFNKEHIEWLMSLSDTIREINTLKSSVYED